MKNRRALVIGGESGIGLAAVRALVGRGISVTIGGVLDDRAKEVLSTFAGDVSYIHCDVRKLEDVQALVKSAVVIDILVYSAGVADGRALAHETSDGLWEQVINVNLRGCFYVARAVLPGMIDRRFGRIVNVSSLSAKRASHNGVAYTASKFGMTGLTRSLACAYAKDGVTVNEVLPGSVVTDIRANSLRLLEGHLPDTSRLTSVPSAEAYAAMIPAQRRGEPHEVASVIAFLASDEAAYITGQSIAVDGGWSAT